MNCGSYTDEDEIAFIQGLGFHRDCQWCYTAKEARDRHIRLLEKYIDVNRDRPNWGRFIRQAQEHLNRIYRDERHPTPMQVVEQMERSEGADRAEAVAKGLNGG